jgi:hypothetical protein
MPQAEDERTAFMPEIPPKIYDGPERRGLADRRIAPAAPRLNERRAHVFGRRQIDTV